MNNVCEVCGDIGFKHLLLCCTDCKGACTHRYCLDKVLYDASLVDWLCNECHQRHIEGSYSRSLGKVSSERSSNHTHFGSTSQQPIINRVESARVFGSWGQRKSKSYTAKSAYLKKINSSKMNSLRQKCIRKKSNTRGMSINRRGCRDASIACTSGKASHSCKSIGAETAENKDGNRQVANENSVQTLKLNNDAGSNHLTPGLKQINHLKPHDDRSKCMKEMKILASTLDNSNESEPSNMNECFVTHEVNSKAGNKPSDEPLVTHQVGDRRGELTIASSQNTSRGDVHFTHRYPNQQHDSFKANQNLNPGSAPELNQTGQSDLERKFSFSVGKAAVNQVSGLKDNSGTILSPKHTDHDKQTNQHASVICKNMKDKSQKDHRTVVGAHQNKYCARNKDKLDPNGDNNINVLDDFMLERENKQIRPQLDHEASNELQKKSIAANGPQPFTPQNDSLGKAMSDLSNMGVLPKENNCLPSMRIESDNLMKNHSGPSKLLDKDNSCSSLEISSEAIVIKASGTEVEISDTLENFGKVKPRKRRRLILNDDDEVEENKAEDVRKENANPHPPKCDEPMTKHRVNTEYCVEEAVQTGELNDQNLMNGRPVKRRRRYIAQNEDEEDILCSANSECALNEATNRSLNDGAKMVPQTSVATDHSQQCRPSHSESDNQQYYIYSQALDEPVWSGVFKIDTEVLMLDAHLSMKACQRVRDLSTSLQPVVELNKLPRSQAWPKRWKSFGPTDDNIGLFFFPHSLRQNEVSNRLVNNLINSDGALKVTVGIAELLIFPSSLLPEQYHFFQGNHYLWGVFRQRKDMADETVLVKEQDGSVKHAVEQGQQQEQDLLDQRDEAFYESSNQETFAVKGHYSTMRCSPGAIFQCIKKMSEPIKQRIRDIGFGDLLKLEIAKLEDRALVMFLMSCIKEDPLRIEFSGKVLPITPEAVHSVFGIPVEGDPFPVFNKQEKSTAKAELREKCDQLGMKEIFVMEHKNKLDAYKKLQVYDVPRWVMEHFASQKRGPCEVPDEWAAQSFMMLVCNALLFCTATEKITGFDYLICKDLNSVGTYNWSQAVVDDIQLKVKLWREKGSKNSTPILQGSTAFLMVYYLDNLQCDAVLGLPQTLPRSHVFNTAVIDGIIKSDKKVFNEGYVSYGKLPLKNVASPFYPNVRAHEEQQSEEQQERLLCAARGRIRTAKGNVTGSKAVQPHLPYGFISLEPVLAESIASIANERLKGSMSESIKTYDLVISNASRSIHEEQRKIEASMQKSEEAQRKVLKEQRMIEVSMRKIEAAQSQISNAQKKLSSDVKSVISSKNQLREQRHAPDKGHR